ncbi:MAG: serine hydrolase [Ignavibacteriaceae bacterium]|nr:serine hydrolase [Ignavibacteriaceae bacterium]
MLTLIKKTILLLISVSHFSIIAQTTNHLSKGNNYDFNSLEKLVNDAISDRAFPGAVVLVSLNGETIFHKSFGSFTYDPISTPVQVNTIFDIASLTKVIATTTAVMICYDRKLFDIEDSVFKFISEFRENGKEKIKIKNLLLHNSGLPAWKKYFPVYSDPDEIIKDIYSLRPEYETGTKTLYSDLGMIVLGKIIESVSGKDFDDFCSEEIFEPLEMNTTFFNPPDDYNERCAPTEYDYYWRLRQLQGEVHDETTSLLNGVAGHAGLFSTAEDISRLLQLLLNKGELNGVRLISKETIELFIKRYSDNSSRALGWDTNADKNSSAGLLFSNKSFGHTGFTGTSVWIDPERNLFVIFLTNRIYPTRENPKIFSVRPRLHDEVVKIIEDR